jgi:putative aminopeptidase FrvX
VPGVIGRKPIHLIKSEERDKAPKLKDLHIDIGAKDGDEANEMVRIGDAGVIDVSPVEMPNGRLVSRALDNRVGCYVAAEAARLVAADGGAPGDVIALAVAQEEATFAGSRTSAFALEPDVAIVVDVIFATDQPGIELGPMTKHPLGSGPVIARGISLHPVVTDLLIDIAEEHEHPFTLESLGGATGTDADAVHANRAGIPTGVVSVPLRYMHSPVELVSLADIQVAAELIAEFAKRLEPGMSFAR